MTIYYRVIEVWCKYPFHQEIDYRYCEFHTSKRYNYKNKLNFTMTSTTTIEEKKNALSEFLGLEVKQVIKLK